MEEMKWGQTLNETLGCFFSCIVDVEDKRELGDNKNTVDVLVHAAEFYLPASACVGCMGAHEHAECCAVQVGDAAEIDNELVIVAVCKPCDSATQLVGFLAACKRAFHSNESDPAFECGCFYRHEDLRCRFEIQKPEKKYRKEEGKTTLVTALGQRYIQHFFLQSFSGAILMFVGHYAVALAAKKPAPAVSLGTLFIAAQFLDLIWPFFLLLGIESVKIVPGLTAVTPLDLHDYPYSHSLLTAIGWSALFGGLYYAFKRNVKSSWILGAAVFSHWVLDFVTHIPDMPLYPGCSTYVGLGLWNSLAGTMIVEGLLLVGAVFVYTRATKAIDKTGVYAFWSLTVLLVVIYWANLFGTPPPDQTSLAVAALGQWLFVPWMYWIDRHRRTEREIDRPAR